MNRTTRMTRCLGLACFFGIACVIWCFWGSSNRASAAQDARKLNKMRVTPFVYAGRLRDVDANSIADLRQAGLHKDASQTLMLRKSLENPEHRIYVYTSIHSLAQLGATNALPAIDIVINSQDEDLSHFAMAAEARLAAEDKSRQITIMQAQAPQKVHTFFVKLNITPPALSLGLINYKPTNPPSGGYSIITSEPNAVSVPVYAVRELADMVYQDSLQPGVYQQYAALPEVSQIDFSQDYAASLKMRLAPLSRQQRVDTLVEDLANKKVLRSKDDYELQLAINEGPLIDQAIAAKLQEMAQHRSQYQYIGFAALFRVLHGTGNPSQSSVIEPFLNDTDSRIAFYAKQAYVDVQRGVKRERIPAY